MRASGGFPVSFEFFPPKTPEGQVKLRAVRQALYAHKPAFCSVTYGAGGSTQQGTFAAVSEILADGCAAASHFSCIGATRASVREQLAELKQRLFGGSNLALVRCLVESGDLTEEELAELRKLVRMVAQRTDQGR